MNTALEVVSGDIWSVAKAFDSVNTDKALNFDAEAGSSVVGLNCGLGSTRPMLITTESNLKEP